MIGVAVVDVIRHRGEERREILKEVARGRPIGSRPIHTTVDGIGIAFQQGAHLRAAVGETNCISPVRSHPAAVFEQILSESNERGKVFVPPFDRDARRPQHPDPVHRLLRFKSVDVEGYGIDRVRRIGRSERLRDDVVRNCLVTRGECKAASEEEVAPNGVVCELAACSGRPANDERAVPFLRNADDVAFVLSVGTKELIPRDRRRSGASPGGCDERFGIAGRIETGLRRRHRGKTETQIGNGCGFGYDGLGGDSAERQGGERERKGCAFHSMLIPIA